jgi:hypothetical protein
LFATDKPADFGRKIMSRLMWHACRRACSYSDVRRTFDRVAFEECQRSSNEPRLADAQLATLPARNRVGAHRQSIGELRLRQPERSPSQAQFARS